MDDSHNVLDDDQVEDIDFNIDETALMLKEMRDDMLKDARGYPFERRREELEWRSILDENGKKREEILIIPIKDISLKHLKSIMKWTDYDYTTNYDLTLHTIKQEYDYKTKMG